MNKYVYKESITRDLKTLKIIEIIKKYIDNII